MFNTFGAHPGACAAVAEVLNIMREEHLVDRVAKLGARLSSMLADAFNDHPHVVECRGRGFLQAIEIVQNRNTLEPFPQAADITNKIVGSALRKGVFYYGGGTGVIRDIVCMGPPFIIEEKDLEKMVGILRETVDEVAA